MAVVDLARDLELGRPVALKRLAENLARDDEIRPRFLREARLAARLSHPNVVRVYDVGEDEGVPFIAMECVAGETLGEHLARHGALPSDDAVRLALQACRGLAAVHEAGLVHRDVKPQNLFLRRDGVLKLGDFGIAMAPAATQLTAAGTVLGTAAYLAPEQARGERVTAAADVYGLGAVLYELLTARPPRSPSTLVELAQPPEIEPPEGVPPALAALVMRCLAEDPAARPRSAAELARELAALLPEAQTLPLPDHPSQRATEIIAPVARRRPRAIVILVAGAAVAVVAGVIAALTTVSFGGGSGSPSRATVTAAAPVSPVPPAASAQQQAKNIAAWLRAHSR
jgi:serine/threonine-protein kinase